MLPRDLPPLPSWAVPVSVKRPAPGTDWREIAKAEQNARKENAGRLICLARYYDERRAELAQGEVFDGDMRCPARK